MEPSAHVSVRPEVVSNQRGPRVAHADRIICGHAKHVCLAPTYAPNLCADSFRTNNVTGEEETGLKPGLHAVFCTKYGQCDPGFRRGTLSVRRARAVCYGRRSQTTACSVVKNHPIERLWHHLSTRSKRRPIPSSLLDRRMCKTLALTGFLARPRSATDCDHRRCRRLVVAFRRDRTGDLKSVAIRRENLRTDGERRGLASVFENPAGSSSFPVVRSLGT